MICLFAVAMASPVFAQTKRTTTPKATPVATVSEMDEFPAALHLTAEQKEKIRKIDKEIANRMNSSERTPAMQAQMDEKMKHYRLEKIRNILTPEQQVVFDERDKMNSVAGKKAAHPKLVELSYEDIMKSVELTDNQKEELKANLTLMDEKLSKSSGNADELNKLQLTKIEWIQKVLSEEQLEKLNERLN